MFSVVKFGTGILPSIRRRKFRRNQPQRDKAGPRVPSHRSHASRSAISEAPARLGNAPHDHRLQPNVYILDLAPVRHKLRDHWDNLGVSVHRIAERMFLNALDGKATYERFDDTYLITFHRLNGYQAQLAGQRLYRQLEDLLFLGKGEEEITGAFKQRHQTRRHHPRREGFFRRLMGWLKAPFSQNIPFTTPESDTSNNLEEDEFVEPPSFSEPTPQSTGKNGQNNQPRHPRVTTRSAPGRADPTQAGDEKGRRHAPSFDQIQSLNLLREARSIENAMIAATLRRLMEWSDDMADRRFPPPDLSFIYRSMWNLGTKHLTTYTSVPVCWQSSLEVRHGNDVVPPPKRPQHLLELDILSLENTIEVLHRIQEHKQPILFMNTVHAATLADRERLAKFKALADEIPVRTRPNLLFEIIGIQEFAYQPEAIEMVRVLSLYARAVCASVGLNDRNFAFWKECGVMAIGANLNDDHRPESEIIGDMGNFAKQAKRHKLISYLRELDRFSTTISAVAAGFEFLEGAVVGSSDDPDNLPLTNFDLENLYREEIEFV